MRRCRRSRSDFLLLSAFLPSSSRCASASRSLCSVSSSPTPAARTGRVSVWGGSRKASAAAQQPQSPPPPPRDQDQLSKYFCSSKKKISLFHSCAARCNPPQTHSFGWRVSCALSASTRGDGVEACAAPSLCVCGLLVVGCRCLALPGNGLLCMNAASAPMSTPSFCTAPNLLALACDSVARHS